MKLWEKYLLAVRKAGSSCGAIIELRASGIPVGLGAPIYSKLDTDIAAAFAWIADERLHSTFPQVLAV